MFIFYFSSCSSYFYSIIRGDCDLRHSGIDMVLDISVVSIYASDTSPGS